MMQVARVMLGERLREAAAVRGEELLAEVPAALRRLGMFLAVLTITVPVFLAGCLAVLGWWLLA